ncbi:hypothetical protein FOL47_010145 [Perkinsus chesapeaki]|uniref:Uncharacterized protein n=1 Tax=Perkinsus chesapeaki TaxID=330153 RepID=A0A7J6L3D6_PERCH|nr:hypothetical protein FOL47_010145 [Perkinsus chesapeaki]
MAKFTNGNEAPLWQFFTVPTAHLSNSYGDFALPLSRELRQTPVDDLVPEDRQRSYVMVSKTECLNCAGSLSMTKENGIGSRSTIPVPASSAVIMRPWYAVDLI